MTVICQKCSNYDLQIQKNVILKTERQDYAPGHPETLFAKGDGVDDWFPCQVDSYGNICDSSGIVVFPSGSGGHPLTEGEHGYFGYFHENFHFDWETSELPLVEKAISLKSARKTAGYTQKELAEKAGVCVSQISKIERGEIKAENLSGKTLLALADALSVDPHNLI